MKVSDYIVAWLKSKDIRTVFELSGGMIAHLMDSVSRQDSVRMVSMHHEQGCAFAADAFGRITGLPGVAMATSGPGATNLLTGIGSCYFDSSPALFITGQVNRYEQKGDRPVRQMGFQETDIVSMARPITKAAWEVRASEQLPGMLNHAFSLATTGRPGPVLIDVPMDIQRAEIADNGFDSAAYAAAPVSAIEEHVWQQIAGALENARRPLILAGGGIRSGRVAAELREFVARTGVPVVHSLMAVDVLPYAHPLRIGMIGSYGNRWANWAVGNADLLLVLGSRLDVRQTGADTAFFRGDRTIIHVDCDAAEINNRVDGCVAVVSELKEFLAEAKDRLPAESAGRHADWVTRIKAARAEWPDTSELSDSHGLNPNQFMHDLSRDSAAASAYVVDVGQHQMWAAQSLELTGEQRFLTSGGMGSMGFALPAAIGTALAQADAPVVMIAGDGGFQCNIQELQTVARNRLPLKMLVINNRCHGMVRQFQQSYFDSRFQSTMWGYSTPDFVRIAEAYGIEARKLSAAEETRDAVQWLWSDPGQPCLLEVDVDPMTNVYPKMAFGRPITEMEPYAQPIDMEGT